MVSSFGSRPKPLSRPPFTSCTITLFTSIPITFYFVGTLHTTWKSRFSINQRNERKKQQQQTIVNTSTIYEYAHTMKSYLQKYWNSTINSWPLRELLYETKQIIFKMMAACLCAHIMYWVNEKKNLLIRRIGMVTVVNIRLLNRKTNERHWRVSYSDIEWERQRDRVISESERMSERRKNVEKKKQATNLCEWTKKQEKNEKKNLFETQFS